MAARAIAGHKDPRTTDIYIHLDADFVRDQHEQVWVVSLLREGWTYVYLPNEVGGIF